MKGTAGQGLTKARRSGVCLLEIMLALSLVTVTIIAFGSVFPAGYRLANANTNTTRATKLANAVVEELRTLPYSSSNPSQPTLTVASSLTMDQLATQGYLHQAVGLGSPKAGDVFFVPFDRSQVTNGKTVANPTSLYSGSAQSVSSTSSGIFITPSPAGSNAADTALSAIYGATISVTIAWVESRNGSNVVRTVTVTSLATNAVKTSRQS